MQLLQKQLKDEIKKTTAVHSNFAQNTCKACLFNDKFNLIHKDNFDMYNNNYYYCICDSREYIILHNRQQLFNSSKL